MDYEQLVEDLENKQTSIEQGIKEVFEKQGLEIVEVELDLGSLIMNEPWIHTHIEIKEKENGE